MGSDSPLISVMPPQSLEELRELAIRIGRGESDISLGGKALDVLSRLVDSPELSAVRTISELADGFGVNASTLTRLAKGLGYDGFGHFQGIFRQAIADDGLYFYSRQAGRLMSVKDENDAEIHIFERLAAETQANVDRFLAQLNGQALREAASTIATAKRVRAYGVRQFHSFVSFFIYGLTMIRGDAALLDPLRLGEAEALAQLARGDVLIVASCAPYTRNVAEVAATAARAGLHVIAITDTRSSPLVPPSRHAFLVPHASSFFSNSMGAYTVFGEGLLNLVARELGPHAIEALARREKLIGDMDIETAT
ncbi:MurR/RpiR family transcriptional regulator [Methylovirgula sp. 4M-Z18]|uniref:MurR/RpiR family transcriptional regulator n=1 Tax=Methylovirgula sp. 4M-Z18 TaxID=2293567 RepID=UPI000E2F65E4|nr:MurR/RpiR family transcriptional regulator [Methylovirgula sp. 4M-Z18]RFB78197.1 MurR/RpiR family transcriptional regulator [Methylovirgula sp. 4M-Z18]